MPNPVLPVVAGGALLLFLLAGGKKKRRSGSPSTDPGPENGNEDMNGNGGNGADAGNGSKPPRPKPKKKRPSKNGSANEDSGGSGLTAEQRQRQERQEMLRQLGYNLTPVDGKSSTQYRQAVRAFQRDIAAGEDIYRGDGLSSSPTAELMDRHGRMDVDGYVGRQTADWLDWAILNKDSFIQITMATAGHLPGQVY